MTMQIKTNNQPRPLVYWYELTDAERAELDYLDTESAQDDFRGFRYKGQVYDLGEFSAVRTRAQQATAQNSFACTVESGDPLSGWHGVLADSYFSGVAVRYSGDFESVTVATFFS